MTDKDVERLIELADAAIEATSDYWAGKIKWGEFHTKRQAYFNFKREIWLT